jgi:signal peptidase I
MDPVRLQPLRREPERDDRSHPASTPPTPPKKPEKENFVTEIFKYALLALIIVIPFRMYVAQPFIVSGASMSPTFETGQYLIIDQLSYHFEDPHRGEVIIFRFPGDPSKFFIKRLIGLPGETVELRGEDIFIRNTETGEEFMLDEPYLNGVELKGDFLTVTLEEGEYFVMGDNRTASSDSRMWGPVPERLIVGRALLRLLPIDQLQFFPGEYKQDAS